MIRAAGGQRRRPGRPCWRRAASLVLLAVSAGAAAAPGRTPAAVPGPAPAGARSLPAIAIIIDDLGYREDTGQQASALPGPVACAVLPHAPYSHYLAVLAHRRHKEVILHLPMESVDQRPLDRGGLTLHMTHREFLQTLGGDLAAVPYVVGVNNHMGSLMTRHPGDMAWLMRALKRLGLFFVDSRTSRYTVAQKVAIQQGLPNTRRNVFLDDNRDPAAIRRQFRRLVSRARRDGTALAIGHPYPHTMAVLRQELGRLSRYGVRLVSVRRLIALQHPARRTWQASLSPP